MKRSAFARLALGLVLCGTLLAGGCAGKGRYAEDNKIAGVGTFAVTALAQQDNLQKVDVYQNGKRITQLDGPVRDAKPGAVRHDFPLPGCSNQTVELFTGGANCCFGYYILTACPDGQNAAYVAPLDGGLGAPASVLRAYAVSDPSFMYYSKETLTFNRPDSPRLTRHILFDNGAWRADKIGELAAAYRSLGAKAKADTKMAPAAKAVVMTYYAYMAGSPSATLEKILRETLPKQYRRMAPAILEDIRKAADGFDPVKNIE